MNTQDNRPRDWGYIAEFDKKDLPSLEEMIKHIRETHDTDMIEDINNKFERKADTLSNGIPIQSVTKTDDLVTNIGLQQCINIILGTSAVRWSHLTLSMSTTASTPTVSDTALNSSAGGPFFISMATYGWMEPRGMKLFFGAIGPTDASSPLGTNTVREMGVYNGATIAFTLLNRETFFNNSPTRTTVGDLSNYSSVFMFSSVIEFCPVA